MNATAYAETPVYMHPAVFTMRPATRPVVEDAQGVSPADVRDLLEAAGSLGIRDIAGGLDVRESAVVATVAWMLSRNELQMDEWNRLRAA